MKKRVISCLLALILAFGMSINALADSINDSSVFVKQSQGGRCTLASVVMMMRRFQILDGKSSWDSITESSIKSTAWIDGAGIKTNFTYQGMHVLRGSFSGTTVQKKAKLIALLTENPEGIVVWTKWKNSKGADKQHGILITDYDGQTFYCSDPAGTYPKGRIKLMDAFLLGSIQDDRVGNLRNFWYITNASGSGQTTTTPTTPQPDSSGTYITVNGKSSPVWSMPQSTGASKKVATLAAGTIVTIEKIQTNSAGNLWGKIANRDSYIYMGNLTTYKAPVWTSLAVNKQSYVTNAANIKVYSEPSSYAGEIRTISTANTAVTVVATTTNAAGNTWGKIKDGECIYMGSLKETSVAAKKDVFEYADLPANTKATVTKDDAAVRSNHSEDAGVSRRVSKGAVLDVERQCYIVQSANGKDDGETWYKIKGKSEWIYEGNVSIALTESVTGTATIIYDANGGSDAPASHTVTKDNNGVVIFNLSTAIPTKSGYTFLGWIDGSNLHYSSGESISRNTGSVTSNETLYYYARWEEISNTVFITYDANGGNGAPTTHYVKANSEGVAVFVLSYTRPVWDGHEFLGWRLENDPAYDIDSLGQTIAIGVDIGVDTTLTYYAQWRIATQVTCAHPTYSSSGLCTVCGADCVITMPTTTYYVKKDRDKVTVYDTPGGFDSSRPSLRTNQAVTVVGRIGDWIFKLNNGGWVSSDNLTKTKP